MGANFVHFFERAREKWGEDKKSERGGVKERKRRKSGDYRQPIVLKNLRGRWRPQYSDWPVWAFIMLFNGEMTIQS